MSRKRTRSLSPTLAAPSTSANDAPKTFLSAPIHDRASTFVALYSPTASAKSLQAYPDFSTASHRIAAWRVPSKQQALHFSSQHLYDSGHDDDGEKYAGKRLERVLEDMQAEGAVVVARHYGGVLLGPVRFTHIENCAREAIAKSRKGVSHESSEGQARSKQRRIDQDEQDKAELLRTLPERDNSITVLRALLVEKTVGAPMKEGANTTPVSGQTPTKHIDYSSIPLPALKQLERARDATITWILKKIDEAEEQQAEATANSPSETSAKCPQLSGDPAPDGQ